MFAGLYVHFPFCSSICPYCDFAVVRGGARERSDYTRHLLEEIERSDWPNVAFQTLYFGGGTPSLVAPGELQRVLAALSSRFDLDALGSTTLEVNPEDVTREAAEQWLQLGFSRLSFGIQSFNHSALRSLGRRHTADEAKEGFKLARAAGFEDLSIDLIFGLPEQPLESWKEDLDQALSLGPDHLSCYQLTIHEGTPFERLRSSGQLVELAEDPQATLFAFSHRYLPDHGFKAYEVSNFAASAEKMSEHNSIYWRHEPYLGLGLGAHSFLENRRWWNHRSLPAYTEATGIGEPPVAGEERLSGEQRALEHILLGLRSSSGVRMATLNQLVGHDVLARNKLLIGRYIERGWLVERDDVLCCTVAGWAVADALAASFDLEA